MNGREMSRQTSSKQTNAQTQAKLSGNTLSKVQEDTRYPDSKSSSSSDGNNTIGNIDKKDLIFNL